MHPQLCEVVVNIQLLLLGVCACVDRLRAQAGKVCLLMRAVSRLQLQMNRMQCPVWPFDFRFYCSSSSSTTYFSGYLLFSLQNNVFLYLFFHFYRFNTPYPPCLLSRSFPDDPKAEWNISLVSTVIMNHIESHAFNLVCSALHKTHAKGFPLSFSLWF